MDTTRMTDQVTTQEDLISAARENIRRQVRWLADQPDGWIHRQRSGKHRILIRKEGTEIRMYYADPSVHSESERMSGRMSELDLKDPLLLFVPYTQGMMMTLLWRDQPQRVYTIGFGAGRVPTILHAHFPALLLESTEIDGEVLPVAQKFFGYTPDKRQKVLIQDGREYLAATPSGTKYDFIHVDAFQGFGHSPFPLATTEFYDLCRQHLVEGGVVCVNLVVSDPLFKARIKTAAASFKNVYLFIHEDATVLYGSDAPRLDRDAFLARAEAIQARCHFSFPLVELTRKLKHVDECAAYLQRFEDSGSPLTDRNPPAKLSAIPKADPIFHNVGRNDPCPCGSGKKFKKCHGR